MSGITFKKKYIYICMSDKIDRERAKERGSDTFLVVDLLLSTVSLTAL